MNTYHEPVLLNESIAELQVGPGKRYIDATAGGGGHSSEILVRGGIVLAIDTDNDAIEFLNTRFQNEPNITVEHANFSDLSKIAKKRGFETIDGILFDLGVSSHQLDTKERGFGIGHALAHMDMRMDRNIDKTAADLINTSNEDELYELFARFGEEELAQPLSLAIIKARKNRPIESVQDFTDVVDNLTSDKRQINRIMARCFQALRIQVNGELTALESGLKASEYLLKHGGRCAVISFHSLEDRIVKRAFGRKPWKIITKRPIIPTRFETLKNPRSRSAKLRVAEKL